MSKQILSEEFKRMQKLAGIINESNKALLQFIKNNQSEIAKKIEATSLEDINSDSEGNVLATIAIDDYEMVSSPNAIFTLDGEEYKMKDVLNDPDMFLGKTVMFKYNNNFKPQKRKIGKIEGGAVGFFEKRTAGSEIKFSTDFIESDGGDEEKSGKIKVAGKTLYYIIYNV